MASSNQPTITPEQLSDLGTTLTKLREGIADVGKKPRRDRLYAIAKEFEAQFKELGGGPPAGQPSTPIAEFLQGMGTSLVEAQRQLDGLSAEYLETTAQDARVLPTVFRLPKVSAEMHIGVRKVSSKGVDLVFFQNKREASEFQEHTIQFEMLGVPPPQEALAKLDAIRPRIGFVLSRTDRDRVFRMVEGCVDGTEGTLEGVKGHALAALDSEAKRNRILLPATGDEKVYLVGFYTYGAAGAEHLGAWMLDPTGAQNKKPLLKELVKTPGTSRTLDFDAVKAVIQAMVKRQTQVLSQAK